MHDLKEKQTSLNEISTRVLLRLYNLQHTMRVREREREKIAWRGHKAFSIHDDL